MAKGEIYGKTNIPTKLILYTGLETDTADVVVDNKEKTIAVNVKVGETVQEQLVSGENIKTINGENILGSGNIEVVTDLSDYSTTEETQEMINNSTEAVYTELSADIEFESSRATEAERLLNQKDVQYFNKFVSGENIDAQFSEDEIVYCTEGSITRGGTIPSTLLISLPQTYGSGGAIYLHSLYINYIDKNGDEQEYEHTFAVDNVADFTAYGQTSDLSGISWLLNQTNATASAPTTSSAKPTGSSIVCLKCGAGNSSTTTRNLTLSTEDLGGCTVLNVAVGVCTTTNGVVFMSVKAANDDWYFNDGESQTEDLTHQITQSKSASPYDGESFAFTNEPDGTELGEATTITFKDVFLTKSIESGEDDIIELDAYETLYLDKSTDKLYRYNGETLVKVDAIEFGYTNTTAYRGDLGQRNYEQIQTNSSSIRTLNTFKPKSRRITILSSDWINSSYAISLDPITVGEFDVLMVTPDDNSAQEYYDCGITRQLIEGESGEGQSIVLTASEIPSETITVQIVYIPCEEF